MIPPQAATRPNDVALGIDIGGTKILAGLVDQRGQVLASKRVPTRPDYLWPDALAACAPMVAAAATAERTIVGIGVGAKGVVDCRTRRLVGSLSLGYPTISIGDQLEHEFGLPVVVENDVHAATIGENVFGIGRRVDNFLFYNAGTGIMVGLVVNGALYRGASGTAGESGHVMMASDGRWPCACGLSGCLETMILDGRRGALLPRSRLANPTSDDPAYDYLITSILDHIELFDPAAVVLSGGMLVDNPMAHRWVENAVRSWDTAGPRRPVVPASAGSMAGLVGAAALLLGGNPIMSQPT